MARPVLLLLGVLPKVGASVQGKDLLCGTFATASGPRGLFWEGNSLLVAEGSSNQVQRWSDSGVPQVVARLRPPLLDPRPHGPWGVAAVSGGTAVAEELGSTVQLWPFLGTPSPYTFTLLGGVDKPAGIAVHGNSVYVADYTKHRVVKSSGILTASVQETVAGVSNLAGPPGTGRLSGPVDVAFDVNGTMYVLDAGNFRVLKYAAGATPTSEVRVAGSGVRESTLSGFGEATGIAVDEGGSVWVADKENGRVIKWVPGAATGELVLTGLNQPFDIELDSTGHFFFVSDYGDDVVYKCQRSPLTTTSSTTSATTEEGNQVTSSRTSTATTATSTTSLTEDMGITALTTALADASTDSTTPASVMSTTSAAVTSTNLLAAATTLETGTAATTADLALLSAATSNVPSTLETIATTADLTWLSVTTSSALGSSSAVATTADPALRIATSGNAATTDGTTEFSSAEKTAATTVDAAWPSTTSSNVISADSTTAAGSSTLEMAATTVDPALLSSTTGNAAITDGTAAFGGGSTGETLETAATTANPTLAVATSGNAASADRTTADGSSTLEMAAMTADPALQSTTAFVGISTAGTLETAATTANPSLLSATSGNAASTDHITAAGSSTLEMATITEDPALLSTTTGNVAIAHGTTAFSGSSTEERFETAATTGDAALLGSTSGNAASADRSTTREGMSMTLARRREESSYATGSFAKTTADLDERADVQDNATTSSDALASARASTGGTLSAILATTKSATARSTTQQPSATNRSQLVDIIPTAPEPSASQVKAAMKDLFASIAPIATALGEEMARDKGLQNVSGTSSWGNVSLFRVAPDASTELLLIPDGNDGTVAIPRSALRCGDDLNESADDFLLEVARVSSSNAAATGALAGVNLRLACLRRGVLQYQPVSGLEQPIVFTLPVGHGHDVVCAYWDAALQMWSQEGVFTTEHTSGQDLVCETRHLTFFGGVAKGFLSTWVCTKLGLLHREAISQLWQAKWYEEPGALLLFILEGLLFVAFLAAAIVDARRRRLWRDEFFIVSKGDALAEPDPAFCAPPEAFFAPRESQGSSLGSFGQRLSQASSQISLAVVEGAKSLRNRVYSAISWAWGWLEWCKDSSAIKEGINEIASNWIEHFAELRSFCESISQGLCSNMAEGRGSLRGLTLKIATQLLLNSSRRLVGSSVGLSGNAVNFVMMDKRLLHHLTEEIYEREQELQAAAAFAVHSANSCESASVQPIQSIRTARYTSGAATWRMTDEQYKAWRNLHDRIGNRVLQQTHRHSLSGFLGMVRDTFWNQSPLGQLYLVDIFQSSKMRVFLLTVDLSGALCLSCVFFEASGLVRGKPRSRADPQCSAGDQSTAGERLGRLLAIACGSVLFAALPALALESLQRRAIRSVELRHSRQWRRILRAWLFQDFLVWGLGTLYIAFCLFFVHVFAASIGNADHTKWSTTGTITVLQDFLVIPVILAIVLPGLPTVVMRLHCWLWKAKRDDVARHANEVLTRKSNLLMPITQV